MSPNKINQLRPKAKKNSTTQMSNGPNPMNASAKVLTDAETTFLKNCRLMAGEGGPSNFNSFK